MFKHKNTKRCISEDCKRSGQAREAEHGSVYCKECREMFQREQDRRRQAAAGAGAGAGSGSGSGDTTPPRLHKNNHVNTDPGKCQMQCGRWASLHSRICADCERKIRAGEMPDVQGNRRAQAGETVYMGAKGEPVKGAKFDSRRGLWLAPGSEPDPVPAGSPSTSTSTSYVDRDAGTGSKWAPEHFDRFQSKGSQQGGGAQEWGIRPLCDNGGAGHDASEPFYTFPDGRSIYGAQGMKINHPHKVGHLDLIIDCANLITAGPMFVRRASHSKYRGLNSYAFPDVIKLEWPDMTAPTNVGARFWIKLFALLPKHTAACCVGGHGRTGTCLACLLVASGMDPDLAIKTVREKHCRRAIETTAQEDYVRKIGRQAVQLKLQGKAEGGQA